MNARIALTRPRPAKLTVDDFLLLDGAGGFDGYAKTELIDGTIYVMSPQHSDHYIPKSLLYRRLADACDALGIGLEAWVEGSIAMPPNDALEPEIFITRERTRTGMTRLETVALAVEVARSSLRLDLGKKARRYAANAVPEYWVVDVRRRVVHRFWSPRADVYAARDEVALGERLESVTITGLEVATAGI